MDAFYASVEQRDNPALRGRPVIVGGHPTRGVVVAASYEVRPFGVHSAMPMSRALRQAPGAVVVPPRFGAYAEASERIFAIFARYTPLCEPLSLDEAFLDVSGSMRLFGRAAEIARRIRREIRDEVDLPASAGIAPVKFIAKIASDLAKPDGQKEVLPNEILPLLMPMPVARLWGVGQRTEQTLHGLGLYTIGQIAAQSVEWLIERLGDTGHHLHLLSHGIDEREVVSDREQKSIGAEDTFAEDLDDLDDLRVHIQAQALRVAARLRQAGLKARVVQLKLKYADHQLATRRLTLEAMTDDTKTIYEAALTLLRRERLLRKVRLTGVSAQDLQEGERQLGLFDRTNGEGIRRGKLNATLDEITRRFGQRAVVPADQCGVGVGDELEDRDDEVRRRVGASRLDVRPV